MTSTMGVYSCTKSDYHYEVVRLKKEIDALTADLTAARKEIDRLNEQIRVQAMNTITADGQHDRDGREIARLKDASGWQQIETLPKYGMFIVVNKIGQVCPAESINGEMLIHNKVGFADWEWGQMPTHWMPLPEPPWQEAEEKEECAVVQTGMTNSLEYYRSPEEDKPCTERGGILQDPATIGNLKIYAANEHTDYPYLQADARFALKEISRLEDLLKRSSSDADKYHRWYNDMNDARTKAQKEISRLEGELDKAKERKDPPYAYTPEEHRVAVRKVEDAVLLKPYIKRITDLEQENAELRDRLKQAQAEVAVLKAEREAGVEVWVARHKTVPRFTCISVTPVEYEVSTWTQADVFKTKTFWEGDPRFSRINPGECRKALMILVEE